jgi:hypothetical protein
MRAPWVFAVVLIGCSHGSDSMTIDEHRAQATRLNNQLAFDHLKAANELERSASEACAGINEVEQRACPLLAPHIRRVEEVAQGVRLHLKPQAPAADLAARMRCHLALAQAHGFDRVPCPLFVKGVRISTRSGADKAIEVFSLDPRVAGEVRLEARQLFGERLVDN